MSDQQYAWLTEKRRITDAVSREADRWDDHLRSGVYVGLWPRDCLMHGARRFVPADNVRGVVELRLKRQPRRRHSAQGHRRRLSHLCLLERAGRFRRDEAAAEGGLARVERAGPKPEADSAQFVVLLAYEYFQRSGDRPLCGRTCPLCGP